jgi:6-phosphogluconolactonase
MTDKVDVYPDGIALAHRVAELFVEMAEAAVATQGRFSVALAGGKTPKAVYSLLATDDFAPCVDWSLVHVFWGDERCVPPEHPDSNYRMARETLLDFVPIPVGNIYRIHGEDDPAKAAEDYDQLLHSFFDGRCLLPQLCARFDLIMLGMGEEGHTASLFPGTAAIHEQDRWVVAHHVEKLDAWRVTITPIALNAASNIIFTVSGANKAEALKQVIEGPEQPDVYPAQIIKPFEGHLHWLADQEAAALL